MTAPTTPTNDKTSNWLRILLTIICLVAFCGGCIVGLFAYRGIDEARQSLQWPKAPGKIVRSEVDVSVHRNRKRDRDRRKKVTRSYSASIEYEYAVDGQTLTGSRIAVITEQFGSKAWAEVTSQKFPVGAEVTVSYNPAKPEQCVLEPGRWGGAGFLLILSAVLGLLPPLALKAIWSTKPLDAGPHPESKSQRILQGFEFRERIVTWEPGQLVHLHRDSMPLLSLIVGAIVAGFVLGLLFGLVPALVFFAGRGPNFIGQFYLAASLICVVICAAWMWLDNRPRETRIDWSFQSIHLAVGSSLCDVFFSDVQELNVSAPNPQTTKTGSSGQQTQKVTARINLVVNAKSYVVLETKCTSSTIHVVRSKLVSLAQQLAESMNVQFANEG